LRRNDRLRKGPRGFHPKAFRTAASDHLSAIRPRVEMRLTALLQLRSISSTLPSPYLEEMTSCVMFTQAPLATAFSALARLDESTSGTLVAPRVSLTSAWTSQTKPRRPEAPRPIPPLLRQQEGLSRPKAPSIDKVLPAIFHREPATGPAALPPEVRLPTLFHPSSMEIALAKRG
jgi:hypothetical protein